MKAPIASLLIVLTLFAHPLRVSGSETGSLKPVTLRCDDDVNPLGVDSVPPRLSWALASDVRGDRQTAWQILAASSPEMLARDTGDLWDSGHVADAESLHRHYRGAALKSSQAVFWKVRVWDRDGKSSAWSEPASWSMGLLADGDWAAKWIGEKAAPTNPQRQAVGYHATEAKSADELKWVQVDLGASRPISAVLLHAMRHAGRDGFGFPVRFKFEVSDDPTFAQATLIADHTGADFKNPGYQAVAFPARDAKGRALRNPWPAPVGSCANLK